MEEILYREPENVTGWNTLVENANRCSVRKKATSCLFLLLNQAFCTKTLLRAPFQPMPEGKAIWRATIISEIDWSHRFTLLRLPPALVGVDRGLAVLGYLIFLGGRTGEDRY